MFDYYLAAIRIRHPDSKPPAPPITDKEIYSFMKQPFTGANDENGGRAKRALVTQTLRRLRQQAALKADEEIGL